MVVGANRDERYDRRSTTPQLLRKTPRVVGGHDEAAGGTWMGIGEHGLWLGIANRNSLLPHNPSRRSRGRLCLDLLKAESCRKARSLAGRIPPARYNPFYLIAADRRTAFLLSVEADTTVRDLEPGVYVLTNSGLNRGDDRRRAQAWRRLLRMKSKAEPPSIKEWAGLLSDHGEGPGDALCLHERKRGTSSSTLLYLHRRLKQSRYIFADGPPCSSPFVDYSHILTHDTHSP